MISGISNLLRTKKIKRVCPWKTQFVVISAWRIWCAFWKCICLKKKPSKNTIKFNQLWSEPLAAAIDHSKDTFLTVEQFQNIFPKRSQITLFRKILRRGTHNQNYEKSNKYQISCQIQIKLTKLIDWNWEKNKKTYF